MKKKYIKILILLSALFMLISTGLGGYTYAKYISAVKGNGELDVAKWTFKVNSNTEQMETIKLSDTILRTVDNTLINSGKIAPGMQGLFMINIDATGTDVGVRYDVEFSNEQNKPANLKFVYGGETYNTLQEINDVITGEIYAYEEDKTVNVGIAWIWPYETGYSAEEIKQNNIQDTIDGQNDLDYTFDITVTGSQMEIQMY